LGDKITQIPLSGNYFLFAEIGLGYAEQRREDKNFWKIAKQKRYEVDDEIRNPGRKAVKRV